MPLELIKNPYLSLKPKPIGHELIAVIAEAPVKGRGLQIHKIKRQEDSALFDFLFVVQKMPPETRLADLAGLEDPFKARCIDMGIFVTPEEVASPVFFSCFLDEATESEAFPEGRQNLRENDENLIVNPLFHYQPDEDAPEALRHRVRFCDRFLRGFSLAWVESSSLQTVFPYWVPEESRSLLAALKPGEPFPRSVNGVTKRLLTDARVFVPSGRLQNPVEGRQDLFQLVRKEFALRRYVAVSELLPPLALVALRRYFKDLIEEGWIHRGDFDSPLRYNAQNEALLFFFHQQLTFLVSQIAGRPLKASHNHFISYLPGAVLKPHKDPLEHEFGISLLLDYRPEPAGKAPWPLVLGVGGERRMEEIEIPQAAGDALFYNASELPHSRRGALPEGHRSSSLLFHFVPQEFAGPLEYSPFYS